MDKRLEFGKDYFKDSVLCGKYGDDHYIFKMNGSQSVSCYIEINNKKPTRIGWGGNTGSITLFKPTRRQEEFIEQCILHHDYRGIPWNPQDTPDIKQNDVPEATSLYSIFK